MKISSALTRHWSGRFVVARGARGSRGSGGFAGLSQGGSHDGYCRMEQLT